MIETLATIAFVISTGAIAYTYLGYPVLLYTLARVRPRSRNGSVNDDALVERTEWPKVSISIPVHNEEHQVGDLIACLLALDYPRDRLQILFVSDASTDRTEAIIAEFGGEGIELLRLPERGGKTRAENAAMDRLSGDIVVNMDASVRVRPDALKPLVGALDDPKVACASGRDLAITDESAADAIVELGYVGYEMSIRDLETEVATIVGASGCFYAVRRPLHEVQVAEELDRDFAAALHAAERGYRAVSVPNAVCTITVASSLRDEHRRKVRTIARGMRTLWRKRALVNPLRTGVFAWMLVSHKVLRWCTPWFVLLALGALGVLALEHGWARLALALVAGFTALAALGWWYPPDRKPPRVLGLAAALVSANVAAAHALFRALSPWSDHTTWRPTRR